MVDIGIHKGTKLKIVTKDYVVKARITKETYEMLLSIEEVTGNTCSEVIRKGIEIQYEKIKSN